MEDTKKQTIIGILLDLKTIGVEVRFYGHDLFECENEPLVQLGERVLMIDLRWNDSKIIKKLSETIATHNTLSANKWIEDEYKRIINQQT